MYNGESSLEKAEKIDNYYGFENGISGSDLYNTGIKQAENIGVKVKKEEVLHIEQSSNGFEVTTTENKYESKALIIATGNKKIRPNIKGIQEFEGKGVSYCAICDGFFYKNKNVVVIGNGKSNNFNTNTNKIKEIKGGLRVQEIVFEDNSTLEVDGVFVALGEAGGADFAKKIGVLTNNDSIVVDDKMKTNVKGLFACGNANGGLLQVSKAVYEGAVAALSAINYLKGEIK